MDSVKLNCKAIVLDFDGTMCRLFKNYDLHNVAVSLNKEMRAFGVNFSAEKDAFNVFSEIIGQTSENAQERELALSLADKILTEAETDAVGSGEPVKGVDHVVRQLVKLGYSIGISTNNSRQCVEAFIDRYCNGIVVPIVGRNGIHPELMKPNPWSLTEVMKLMKSELRETVFIGDTQRDYDCAMSIGCNFIGMAPTDLKRQRLLKIVSENKIISDYYELFKILQE